MTDAQTLKQRILDDRLQWRQCGGYSLQIERPTELQWYAYVEACGASESPGMELDGERAVRAFRKAARFVHNWDGVTFGDLASNGMISDEESGVVAPFDPNLLDLLIQEKPDVGSELFQTVKELYLERHGEHEEEKKSKSGSKSRSGSNKQGNEAT